jgi:hypothetical protein
MFTLELIINPIVVTAALAGGILVGYSFRKRKLAKLHAKLLKLEDEMMESHAEILELQKEYVRLENNTPEDESIPVIPMKHGGNKDNPNPKGKASK